MKVFYRAKGQSDSAVLAFSSISTKNRARETTASTD